MAIVASAVMSDHQKFNSNGNSKGGTGCEAHHCCYQCQQSRYRLDGTFQLGQFCTKKSITTIYNGAPIMTVTMSIYSNTISTHKVIRCPRIIITNEVRQNAPMVTRLFFPLLFWGEGDGGQGDCLLGRWHFLSKWVCMNPSWLLKKALSKWALLFFSIMVGFLLNLSYMLWEG